MCQLQAEHPELSYQALMGVGGTRWNKLEVGARARMHSVIARIKACRVPQEEEKEPYVKAFLQVL